MCPQCKFLSGYRSVVHEGTIEYSYYCGSMDLLPNVSRSSVALGACLAKLLESRIQGKERLGELGPSFPLEFGRLLAYSSQNVEIILITDIYRIDKQSISDRYARLASMVRVTK